MDICASTHMLLHLLALLSCLVVSEYTHHKRNSQKWRFVLSPVGPFSFGPGGLGRVDTFFSTTGSADPLATFLSSCFSLSLFFLGSILTLGEPKPTQNSRGCRRSTAPV